MKNLRPELRAELKKLDSFFDSKNYPPAIDRLNDLLKEYKEPEEVAWILRERASYYRLLSEDNKALEDLFHIIGSLPTEIEDYFYVGKELVRRHDYEYALVYLDHGINKSNEDKNMYYYDSFLFIRAFALIKTNKYAIAKELLDKIDPSDKYWIDRNKPYTKDELLRIINVNERNAL
jgi:tetratricopeptide (TPR) repeat protein